jgi:hypothetical protein
MEASPHPLISGVVQVLLKRAVKGYTDAQIKPVAQQVAPDDKAVQKALGAARFNRTALDDAIIAFLEKDPKTLTPKETNDLVSWAEGVDFPDVVAFSGYLGGTISGPPPGRAGDWRVLYLDSQLQNWLLISDDDIFISSRVWAEDAAFNVRDVIWVDRDALTTSGGAPPRPEAQAQYLRGDFTRAHDLVEAGIGGGPPSDPQTGVFCPITPRCCTRPVRPTR